MVKIFILVMTMLWSMTLTTNAWWFWGNDDDSDDDNQQQVVDEQKQEIARLQGVADQEEHTKDTWQILAFVLGVGCVGSLVVGAAMGSYARRNLKEEHQ